jgi:alanyl-tRNA synthetase
MTSDEIRERYLEFFAQRDHLRIPSASLVPPPDDRTVLLTTAGMQPLKPYFLGRETPPAPMLTSCQKCFRTPDIDHVGSTLRHLTFFEMLGNFSIGAYFKTGAIRYAWDLSREVFGFHPDDIWVTVFAGDELLGLGPDEEAIELWQAVGVPRERIVPCPRSENFWEAGPIGPSGPCSELYIDRGLSFGEPDDLPGGENERFLEYWNLVFMQYDQRVGEDGNSYLRELPARNIDTGLGLNRLAAIMQGRDSVFDTDQFQPLIELGGELAGRPYGADATVDRALRILADHARGMSFLIADGVVPSNEDRGYVLRRLTRRAILQARRLQMAPGFLVRYAAVVRELMGGSYPELGDQREAIERWLAGEEDAFGRTLEQGTRLLDGLIERARDAGERAIAAADAFALHDTYGFPVDLTRELAAEHGLGVDEQGFERLMDAQRDRARAAAAPGGAAGLQDARGADPRERARELGAAEGVQTRFTGYETELQQTTISALTALDGDSDAGAPGAPGEREGHLLVKLAESPFYPAGGGQVSDTGTIECASGDCRARVAGVLRLGDDQALDVVLERGSLDRDEPVLARVDHLSRRATERNHTATHLLHAALRERLGAHVRQAGSYVGPDKLRFDFTHTGALSSRELRDVEDAVNAHIATGAPVRAITTTLQEAKRLGAMALFGEKYGEVVRMVQIGDGSYSRELCGGTHVRDTAEIGVFHVLGETSSAANVRRIEAITGAAASELLRARARELAEVAKTLRTTPERSAAAAAERERIVREIERAAGVKAERVPARLAALARQGGAGEATGDAALAGAGPGSVAALAQGASSIDGVPVLVATVEVPDAKALPDLVDRVKGQLPGAGAIVLGAVVDGRAALVASVAPVLVERGLRAGELVKTAAALVGGGGGGRDTLAQAGGRDPDGIEDALAAARAAIAAVLGVADGEATAGPGRAAASSRPAGGSREP